MEVEFPFEPYGSQCALMDKIISALSQRASALLESPTGSGKTMALLCATLAWRSDYFTSSLKASAKVRKQTYRDTSDGEAREQHYLHEEKENLAPNSIQSNSNASLEADHEDFKHQPRLPKAMKAPSKFFSSGTTSGNCCLESNVANEDALCTATQQQQQSTDRTKPLKESKGFNSSSNSSSTKKAPKIFYTSRTHAQIAQVVAELNRCPYSPKSVVLGSREQMCINGKVRKKANKENGSINHECKQAIDGGHCSYAHNTNRLVGHVNSKFSHALDVEELCEQGRRSGGCPYFAAKALAQDAELVMCPYNYLVDPYARKSMDLDLTDAIVVLDEAHNIEDASRSAVSGCVSDSALEAATNEFSRLSTSIVSVAGSATLLAQVLACTKRWLQQDGDKDGAAKSLEQTGLFTFSASFSGNDMLHQLRKCSVGTEESMRLLMEAKEALEQQAAEAKPGEDRANHNALECVEQLVLPLSFLISGNCRDSYRLVVEENLSGTSPKRWMCLWCMDPWVGFQPLAKQARSIILTSGTLSPLDSFPSELGMKFKYRLEAQHCVDLKSQVWASTLLCGPNNQSLNGSFRTSDAVAYQDAIAQSITYFCEHVPAGVLVFFPSHSLLSKLVNRWRSTGAIDTMKEHTGKQIVYEPRSQSELDSSLRRYRNAIDDCGGAILLAVCRGRVSEGMDFADDNARGVVVVGVPYPNVKDLQVSLKRAHNDSERKHQGQGSEKLSGSEWYTQQAFRALNQAVGRCIRHRDDAGAILLMDERFATLANKLPRWMRPRLEQNTSPSAMLASLDRFVSMSSPMQNAKKKSRSCKEGISEQSEANQALSSAQKETNELHCQSDWASHIHPAPPEARGAHKPQAASQPKGHGKHAKETTGVDRIRALWNAAAERKKHAPKSQQHESSS